MMFSSPTFSDVLMILHCQTLDTTERDRALEEVEKEKELRKKAELARAQARLHYQLAIEECNRLRSELDKARKQLQEYRSVWESEMQTLISFPILGPFSSLYNAGRHDISEVLFEYSAKCQSTE